MNWNISVLVLGIIFVVMLIIKIFQNYRKKKIQKDKKKEVISTGDIINVLFNVALFTAGIASLLLAVGAGNLFFGQDLSYSQPVINFLAGVLFIWFAIRNIFYGGKV